MPKPTAAVATVTTLIQSIQPTSRATRGRDDIRTLEAEVYDNQPPLFKESLSAPLDERNIIDNQFKNMKVITAKT